MYDSDRRRGVELRVELEAESMRAGQPRCSAVIKVTIGRLAAAVLIFSSCGDGPLRRGGSHGKAFNASPSDMSEALQTYSEQADVELAYSEKDVSKLSTDGVEGVYSQEAALGELISDTDVSCEVNENGSVVIRTSFLDMREAGAQLGAIRVAQAARSARSVPKTRERSRETDG